MLSFPTQRVHLYRANKTYSNLGLINTYENKTDKACSFNLRQKELFDALKQYDFALKYYNNNLNKNKRVVSDINLLNKILSDSKASKNLYLFIGQRARNEILELNKKYRLTEQEKDRLSGLKEIVTVFNDIDSYVKQNSELSFKGAIDSEKKKRCHIAIHSASTVCAGISAVAGEGAAIGADTWFLRGVQALMFFYLKDLLGVDAMANLMYIGRQYVMGSYLGVRGAQILLGWLGLGGHVASYSTASAPITSAVRGVNSLLSTVITEKMGWGYVKSYEQDTMNARNQFLLSSIYLATMGILHFQDQSLLNPSNTSDIQTALSNIPEEDVTTFGQAIHTLSSLINLPRAGAIFTSSMLQGIITTRNLEENDKKEYFKNLIKISLLNTIFYEVINIPEENLIKEEAIAAIEKLKQDIENTPEVFQEFQRIQQDIIGKLNIDNINTRDFVKQFKDKEFVTNLAYTTGEAINIIADKWRKRNFATLKESNEKTKAKLEEEKIRSVLLNSSMTSKQIKELDKELDIIISQTKENMLGKTRANHALSRIAGYDAIKTLLNTIYLSPVKNKDENSVPSLLLFYGPSGVGKTVLGSALAEDAGTRFKNKTLGMYDEARIIDWIKDKLIEGEEIYKTSKRFSIIQLNEFDDFFNKNEKLLEDFLELIDNCAKKYHTTIFLTTNNPLLINSQILKKVDLTIPIGVASKNDIKDIVKYYINDREIEEYNLDEITNEFDRVKPDYMYSNAQIENIIDKRLPKTKCSQKDIINIIHSVKPCISKEINEKFENEQKFLKKEYIQC